MEGVWSLGDEDRLSLGSWLHFLSVCPSIHPPIPSIHPSIYLSIGPSIHPSIL